MANFNFNHVILGGRLTADPELKTTPSGISVTSFTIAVNRAYAKDQAEQKTDFINCVAWRNTAEFITKYFRRASSICVVGRLQVRSWVDNSGAKRYATDVQVDEAQFVDSRAEAPAAAPAAQTAPAAPSNSVYSAMDAAPGYTTQGVANPQAYSSAAPQQSFAPTPPPPDFEPLSEDEELPF